MLSNCPFSLLPLLLVPAILLGCLHGTLCHTEPNTEPKLGLTLEQLLARVETLELQGSLQLERIKHLEKKVQQLQAPRTVPMVTINHKSTNEATHGLGTPMGTNTNTPTMKTETNTPPMSRTGLNSKENDLDTVRGPNTLTKPNAVPITSTGDRKAEDNTQSGSRTPTGPKSTKAASKTTSTGSKAINKTDATLMRTPKGPTAMNEAFYADAKLAMKTPIGPKATKQATTDGVRAKGKTTTHVTTKQAVQGNNARTGVPSDRPVDAFKKSPSLVDARKNSESKKGDTMKRLLMQSTDTVAFHATLDGGLYSHKHIDQMLVFDKVKMNIGGAYNNLTGIFVTPQTGLYIFSTSVRAVNNSVHIDIMKNGVEVGAAYAQTYDQGSVTIPLVLDLGDTVHVSVERHEDINIWGDKLTSFMGCLIMSL